MAKENIEKLNALLSEWDGCVASINSMLLPDEQHFVISIVRPGSVLLEHLKGIGCVGVTLFCCGFISGPTIWAHCKLRSRKAIFKNEYWSPGEDINGYELFDEEAKFTMHCYDNIRYGNEGAYVRDPS
ncbi:MAG TPA: hypothetical protein VIF82_05775 [Burkholderiaceae bacterium]|jgi:hypothetical protein